MCRSEVTGQGLQGLLPHGASFICCCILTSGFVIIGTISTLFYCVNTNLILCRSASYACNLYEIVIGVAFVDFIAVLALQCNPVDFIQNQNGGR